MDNSARQFGAYFGAYKTSRGILQVRQQRWQCDVMGSCTSSDHMSGDITQALVVDAQKVITDYVWRNYRNSQHSWWDRRFLKRRNFIIDMPMNYYHFEQTKQEISVRKQGNGGRKDSSAQLTEKDTGAEKLLPDRDKATVQRKGLQTAFTNDTAEAQMYSFHFEKVRRSEAHVSYQKGFSFGGCTDFSINLPKILPGGELGAELDMHMEVTKAEEQTFGEESITSMTNDVLVSPKTHCVVNVILEDNHFTADYKVHIIMDIPGKEARIPILNKRHEQVTTFILRDISTAFADHHKLKDERGKARKDAVRFVVEGVIRGTQVSNQRIKLDSKLL